jgi:hypothetical protein
MRKRSNARRQPDTNGVPENPFSIFNEGPGNPSLRKEYLFQRREDFVCLIEPVWYEFGWELKCARTAEQVRQAFQKIAENVNSGRLMPILRITSEPATKATIESTRRMHDLSVEKSRSLANTYQAQLQTYEECQRSNHVLSNEFKEELEKDLKRRKENIRAIKIAISTQKGNIRKAQLQREGKPSESEPDLPTLERALNSLQCDLAADEDVCRSLEKRIRSITKEVRRVVAEETVRQKGKLNSLEQESRKADLESRKLETTLLDQEAFFFRSQLLDFIKKADYEFTPRNVANALAGLPYITSRRSAELCSATKSDIAPSSSYEVLMFIASAWKRYDASGNLTVTQWLKLQISDLPRYKIIEGKKIENHFRAHLAGQWFFMKRALDRSRRSRQPPGFVPFVITREFLRLLANPESPADSILAANNKITD